MYRLSLTIMALLGFWSLLAQSPHGKGLKMDCAKCHNPTGWTINPYTLQFNHDKTDYPLEGAHSQVDCKLCHTTLVFNEVPSTDCVSCHADMHSQSVGNDCVRCHTPQTWLVDNIPELHEENGFPLIGAHGNLSCVECHTSETTLRFDRIGNDCISCHREDYASTQSPNHETAGFSTDCIECHNPLGFGWDSAGAGNHDFFPLTEGHDIQDCTQCHTTGNYADASPECVSCHQDDYAGTQNPNHSSSGFSTDCISCHTTAPGWTPAVVNHDFFPLTLGHDIQDCAQCHATGNYADASPECVSCHQNDYAGTQDPNHQTSGFSTDCASCHTTNPGWSPATINHDFFPLTQGHDLQDCTQCHTNGTYAGLSPDCVNCHQSDYNGTQDPNHQTSGFSTDCVSCHSTNPGWSPATINHDFFPLTQGHDLQDCTQCHTNGNYAGLSPDCVNCHQSDYNGTQDPNHQTSGFSTDCVSCHTTNPGWSPATINHDFFPLTQGHDLQDCTQCHTNGTYAGLSPDCVTCHQNDYDQTNDPNHQAAGFPTDCVSCHTTRPGWSPSSFDHDNYFPIYSGNHRQGETWDTCLECHTTPNNFGVFDCIRCHRNDHNTSQGNQRCYECHPNGRS